MSKKDFITDDGDRLFRDLLNLPVYRINKGLEPHETTRMIKGMFWDYINNIFLAYTDKQEAIKQIKQRMYLE